MELNFNTSVLFEDSDIQEFFLRDFSDPNIPGSNPKLNELMIWPKTKSNLDFKLLDENLDIRPNDKAEFLNISYIVKEHWQVLQGITDHDGNPVKFPINNPPLPNNDTYGGTPAGIIDILVNLEQKLSITPYYFLYFRTNPPNPATIKAIEHGRELLGKYKQSDGDIEQWIKTNMGPDLKEEMFILDVGLYIVKTNYATEIHPEQRLALLRLYDLEPKINDPARIDFGSGEGTIMMGNTEGWTMRTRAKQTRSIVVKIDSEFYIENSKPQLSREIVEVPKADDASADTALQIILGKVVPSECGVMETRKYKLLALSLWPEFKIEWKETTIKIGCTSITFPYPVVRIRWSSIVFWVYFSMPQNLGTTILKIAETCAIRAALGGSVVGIVVCNPGAAVVAFNALFKACIENEIKTCVNPGILTLIEAGPWN
jgi:hypothetical protein